MAIRVNFAVMEKEPIIKPDTHWLRIGVSPELHHRVKVAAGQKTMDVSKYVRWALDRATRPGIMEDSK